MTIVVSQTPDGGAWPVSRTVEVTELVPKRGDAVQVTFQSVAFSSEEQERVFTTAVVRLPEGRMTPALEKLNAKLATLPDLEDVQQRLSEGNWQGDTGRSIEVVINRHPFLDVRICDEVMGSYPWSDCSHVRLNVESGEEWNWTDAILGPRRDAFFAECSLRISQFTREHEDVWVADGAELEMLRMYGFLPTQCTSRMFDAAEFSPDGESLTMWNGRGAMHALEPMVWPLTFSRAELKKWIDPKGPLGQLTEKR